MKRSLEAIYKETTGKDPVSFEEAPVFRPRVDVSTLTADPEHFNPAWGINPKTGDTINPATIGATPSIGQLFSTADLRKSEDNLVAPIRGLDYEVPTPPGPYREQLETLGNLTDQAISDPETELWNKAPRMQLPDVQIPFARAAAAVTGGMGGGLRMLGAEDTGKAIANWGENVNLPASPGELSLQKNKFEWNHLADPEFWTDGRAVALTSSAAGSSFPFIVGSLAFAAAAPEAGAALTTAAIARAGQALLSTAAGRATIGRIVSNPYVQSAVANIGGRIGDFGKAYIAGRTMSSVPEALVEGGTSYNEMMKWNDAVSVLRNTAAQPQEKLAAQNVIKGMYEQNGGKPGTLDLDHVPMMNDAKFRAWMQTAGNVPMLAVSNAAEGFNFLSPSKGIIRGAGRKMAFGGFQNALEEYLQAGMETGIPGVGKNATPIQGEDFVWSLNPANWSSSAKQQAAGGLLFGVGMGAVGGGVNSNTKPGLIDNLAEKLSQQTVNPTQATPIDPSQVMPGPPPVAPEPMPAQPVATEPVQPIVPETPAVPVAPATNLQPVTPENIYDGAPIVFKSGNEDVTLFVKQVTPTGAVLSTTPDGTSEGSVMSVMSFDKMAKRGVMIAPQENITSNPAPVSAQNPANNLMDPIGPSELPFPVKATTPAIQNTPLESNPAAKSPEAPQTAEPARLTKEDVKEGTEISFDWKGERVTGVVRKSGAAIAIDDINGKHITSMSIDLLNKKNPSLKKAGGVAMPVAQPVITPAREVITPAQEVVTPAAQEFVPLGSEQGYQNWKKERETMSTVKKGSDNLLSDAEAHDLIGSQHGYPERLRKESESAPAAPVEKPAVNQKQKAAWEKAMKTFEKAKELDRRATSNPYTAIENPWPAVIEALKEVRNSDNISDARIDEAAKKMIESANRASVEFERIKTAEKPAAETSVEKPAVKPVTEAAPIAISPQLSDNEGDKSTRSFDSTKEQELKDRLIAKKKLRKIMDVVDDSDEALAEAVKRLSGELNKLSANPVFNPDLMAAALEVGLIYTQRGVNNYGDWAAKMAKAVGDKIKPYLPSTWQMINNFPAGEKNDNEVNNTLFEYAGIQYEKGATTFDALSKKITEELGDEFKPYVKMVYEGIIGWKSDQIDGGVTKDVSSKNESNNELPSGTSPVGNEGRNPGLGQADSATSRQEPVGDSGKPAPEVADMPKPESPVSGTSAGERKPSKPGPRNSAKPNVGKRGGDLRDQNYIITEKDSLGKGGAVQKYNDNLAAIRMIHKLNEEARQATPDEQAVLVKYVGWGGFPQLFDAYLKSDSDWYNRAAELKTVLSDEEYKAARASTTNAHYTSETVIREIWKSVQKLGFSGGRVLEPSMGTGNFFGLIPKAISDSKLTGVELDTLTGAIAKQLYPGATIHVKGFESAPILDEFYDLAISNVPFGDYSLHDPKYNKYKLNIHNYFFVKSLDKVRPGGLVVFITGSGTMQSDKQKAVREMIANRAELVGAIKMPNTAFKENAKTEVTTDLLILRKLMPGELPTGNAWGKLASSGIKSQYNYHDMNINEYFAANPDMMLGELYEDKLHPGRLGLKSDGRDLGELMSAALAKLPESVYSQSSVTVPDALDVSNMIDAPGTAREGSVQVSDGKPFLVSGGKMTPINLDKKDAESLSRLVGIREQVRDIMRAQLNPDTTDDALDALRATLKKSYDAYVKQNGLIDTSKHKALFANDPDSGLIFLLENFEDKKNRKNPILSDIFTTRTIQPFRRASTVSTPEEALIASLQETGRVDMARISSLLGSTEEDAINGLEGLIFRDPKFDRWEAKDKYLSGNVRVKLAEAKEAAKSDKRYSINVSELEKVIPEDKKPHEITAKLGSPWIEPADIQEFISHLFDIENAVTVKHDDASNTWIIEPTRNMQWYGGNRSAESRKKWGTDRFPTIDLVDAILNNTQIVVKDKDIDDKLYVNAKETAAAQDKARAIKEEFNRWTWDDAPRSERLARIYNDKFNATRLYEANGEHLEVPGLSTRISLRPHQKNAIWRIVQGGNALIAHAVGLGKTLVMQAAGMKLRQLGLSRKPMYVIPNATVSDFETKFREAFPTAKLLVISSKALPAETPVTKKVTKHKPSGDSMNKEAGRIEIVEEIDGEKTAERIQARRATLSRIATEDWDGVIITHTMFKRLPMSPESQAKFIEQVVDDYAAAIEAAKAESGNTRYVKQLEAQKKRWEAKLTSALTADRKSIVTPFEELGIDYLFVDEADMFKNLGFATKMGRIAGVQNSDSQRALDMYSKTTFLNETNNGSGVVFATGTPISNTMGEMFTMKRYMIPQRLRELNIAHFDAWAANFGESIPSFERDVSGKGFRTVERFAKFVNAPEMITMFREFADVKRAEDVNLPLPELRTGKRQTVVSPISPELKKFISEDIAGRVAAIRGGQVKPDEDNMLVVTGDLRKAALDIRLVVPGTRLDPDAKINKVANNVFKIWQDTKSQKSTQIVFCDMSIPKSEKEVAEMEKIEDDDFEIEAADASVYQAIQRLLMEKGVPKDEVVFIHDAKNSQQKQALFDKMNAGTVRVLIGSTGKAGVGLNVQKKLVAAHHVDVPWRPRDLEQREGRIVRQGNENDVVDLFVYATEDSADSLMWERLTTKQRFIQHALSNNLTDRTLEEDDMAIGFAEIAAITSGDPRLAEKFKLENKATRLRLLREKFESDKQSVKISLSMNPRAIEAAKARLAQTEQDIAARKDTSGDKFNATLFGVNYTDRKGAEEALSAFIEKNTLTIADKIYRRSDMPTGPIGMVGGLEFEPDTRLVSSGKIIAKDKKTGEDILLEQDPVHFRIKGVSGRHYSVTTPSISGIENSLRRMDYDLAQGKRDLEFQYSQGESLKALIDKPFDQESEYQEAKGKLEKLIAELAATEEADSQKPDAKLVSFPSNLDPFELIPALRKYQDMSAKEALADLSEVGRRVYLEGKTTSQAWVKRMREVLGDLWVKAQKYIVRIWNEVKATAGNNRGAVRMDALGFYSQTENVIDDMDFKTMPAADLLNRVSKASGVKSEELDDLGLREWLSTKQGKVSKEEVLDFVRKGGPKLEEVTLDSGQINGKHRDIIRTVSAREAAEYYNDPDAEIFPDGNVWYNNHWATEEQLQKFAQYLVREGFANTTKYSEYQMDGWENYREFVLTMPEQIEPYRPDNVHFTEEGGGTAIVWGRVNDRTIDGKRYMVVEEIQSKRHQDGKKRGYRGNISTLPEGLEIEQVPVKMEAENGEMVHDGTYMYFVYDKNGKEFGTGHTAEEATQEAIQNYNDSATPNAPFKSTPAWSMLMFKRLLGRAINEGYDGIAWTPGEVQAERYDLSKEVDRLTYEPGNKILSAYRNGSRVINERVSPENLDKYVGKDAASKLIESPLDDNFEHSLSGGELKVGGEGMKGFYNKILPAEVGKYVKKLDPTVKVGTVRLESQDIDYEDTKNAFTPEVDLWSIPITDKMRGEIAKGQPLYSFPPNPFQLIPGLRKYEDMTVPEAFNDLVAIGRAVYDQGTTHGGKWMAKMKKLLGDQWSKAKKVIGKVWNAVKKYAGNNRGAARPGVVNDAISNVAASLNRAVNRAAEKMDLKADGVTVRQPGQDRRIMNVFDGVASAKKVAERHSEFMPFYKLGKNAVQTQERLRSEYRKQLAEIEKLVAEKDRKKTLYSILIEGDLQEATYSESELQTMGADENVIKAYQQLRALYDDAWNRSNEVKKERIASGEAIDAGHAVDQIGYRKGYVPHFWHQWMVLVDGVPVASGKSVRDAIKFAKLYEGDGEIVIQPRSVKFEGEDVQAALIGDFAHARLVDKMQKTYSLSTKEAEELATAITKQSRASRFVGNFLERKGAEGWTKDLDYANHHYFNMISRFIALDEFKGKAWGLFEKLYGDQRRKYPGGTLATFTQDYINDVNGVPVDIENKLNEWIKQAPVLYKFLGAYLPDRPALQIASATTKAVAVAKLGLFNLSSGLVQVNQLLNINAKLGGGVSSYAGLGKWTRNAALHAMRPNKIDKVILEQVGVDYDLAMDSGSGYSKAGNLSKLMEASLYFFHKSDIFLRRVAALGAYAKSTSEGKSHEEAIAYAKDINDVTNFDYSVANTPNIMRRSGPVGQVLLQFKKYPIMQAEYVFSLKGAEHARYWIPLVMISGLYGFPFTDLLLSLAKWATGDDWELEGKKALYQWAGKDPGRQHMVDMALGGIPRAFMQIDAARRIGMSDLVPNELSDLTGPAISTIGRVMKLATQERWAQAWPEMIRSISPSVGNMVVGLQGERLGKRGRVQEKYGLPETAAKMIGFMPLKESKNTDARRILQQDEGQRRKQEAEAIDDYIFEPSPQTKAKIDELGITDKRIEDERKKKGITAIDRQKNLLPGKRRGEYEEFLDFEDKKKRGSQAKPKFQFN
jgi:N12 class adenine-specific DNA methylase